MNALAQRAFPPDTEFTRDEAFSLALAYFTVGLTVTVLHVSQGTSVPVMLFTVFFVNSVTPGLAYIAVTAAGGSTWAGIASGWLVSTRFGLFAAAIGPRLWPSLKARAAAAHVMFDPNVAMAMREPDDRRVRSVFAAAAFWMVVPWWIGGTIGSFIGRSIGDPDALGLDAIFPAVLVVIVWPQLRQRDSLVIAIVAVVAIVALVETTPGGVPVLAAAAAALLALRPSTPATQSDEDAEDRPC